VHRSPATPPLRHLNRLQGGHTVIRSRYHLWRVLAFTLLASGISHPEDRGVRLHVVALPPLDQLRPTPTSRHSIHATFDHKNLQYSNHVFLRRDATHRPLETPYVDPYKVMVLTDKTLQIFVCGRQVTVLTNRVKPAYKLEGTQHDICSPPAHSSGPLSTPVTTQTLPRGFTFYECTVCFPASFAS